MEWISVKDSLPEIDIPLYFSDGEYVIRGSFCETTYFGKIENLNKELDFFTKIIDSSQNTHTVITFAGDNLGYDGDNAPVFGITHWMYENIPKPPV